jgi:hypothetical protein
MWPPRDAQLRKLERNAVQIGNRSPGLRFLKGSGMSDLCAERNVEFATLRKQRIVTSIIRRQSPQPGQDAQTLETVLPHTPTQLAHAVHRSIEIDRRDAGEAAWMGTAIVRHLVVADHRPERPVPGTQHADRDARLIHLGNSSFDRLGCLRPLAGFPPAHRVEHGIADPLGIRVLHPGIDDHGIPC